MMKTEFTGLEKHGFTNLSNISWDLSTAALYEQIIRRREGLLAHLGPIVVKTGHHTGRSPGDKFIVKEETSEKNIFWSTNNKDMSKKHFDRLYARLQAYLQNNEVFVQECYACAEDSSKIKLRVVTEYAWHNLFARNMFIRETNQDILESFEADFLVVDLPRFHAIPEIDGTATETFIIINFEKKVILIGGTSYAGELKKSVFTVLNYLLPLKNILSMHCSANVGKNNDVALFFGLSGTGKTTLSTDPSRFLIGDDEHGWSDDGIFNIEGGCYAKVIRLSPDAEPDIYECTRKFGTILENVMVDVRTRRINLDDDSFTENTRASYPLPHLPNIVADGKAGHPSNIIFLTYDAFGVLPPVAKLASNQAMYHFISGYTAKVAGTEKGVKEPKATFSACFGAPFMVHHPNAYARLLGQKMEKYNVKCWLVNTGLTGGPYGIGKRFEIKYTRKIIDAILNGELEKVKYRKDEYFGFMIPRTVPNVPVEALDPSISWDEKEVYIDTIKKLANSFKENFNAYKSLVDKDVLKGGPIY